MQTYTIESLDSEDEEGRRTWTIAARRGPKMDNGPAIGISADEALELLIVAQNSGWVVRARRDA